MLQLRGCLNLMSGHIDQRIIRIGARTSSVILRRLLLEGLLHRAVRGPRFHKLVKPLDPEPLVLDKGINLSYLPTLSSKALWVTHRDDRFEIHSLPGLIHKGFMQFELDSDIFGIANLSEPDKNPPELNVGRWINQKVFKVEPREKPFSLRDILHYVADTEGGHPHNYNKGKKAKYAQFLELLGSQDTFIYPHWLVICVAIYLHNRHARGLNSSELWDIYVANDVVTNLDDYLPKGTVPHVHLKGEGSLPMTGPFVPLGINLDDLESPPPEYQKGRWSISSAV